MLWKATNAINIWDIEDILSEELTGQDLKDKEATMWQAGGKTLQAGEHK